MSQQVVIFPSNYIPGVIPATILKTQDVIDPTLTDNFIINFPNTPPQAGCALVSDALGNLSWQPVLILMEKYLEQYLEKSGNVFQKKILASKTFKSQLQKLIQDTNDGYEVV